MGANKKQSAGQILLLVLGLITIISLLTLGGMALQSTENQQKSVNATQEALIRAELVVLSYVRQNKVLPSTATFNSLSNNIKDTWGHSLLYFPDNVLLSGDICSAVPSYITLKQCGNDTACALPATTSNIPFLIASSGTAVKSLADPIYQTTSFTTSTNITSSHTFKQYSAGLPVGAYGTPATVEGVYDDMLLAGNFAKVLSAAQCLSKTQGDVASHGGTLEILNSDKVGSTYVLPSATCQIAYIPPKVISAYGSTSFVSGGSYTWSVTGLPTGMSAGTSGSTTTISGTPTQEGNFTVTVQVTDPVSGRISSRPYSLTVNTNAGAWVNNPGSCYNTGGFVTNDQTYGCSGATRANVTATAYWVDNGTTQTLSCGAGYGSGSISQKQQTNSCDGSTQWVTTLNSCVAATYATVAGGRFTFTPSTGPLDMGVTSISTGVGAAQITLSASSNLTRHSTISATPAVGVKSGATYGIDHAETLNIDFNGGYARKFGIEFRGLGIVSGVKETATIVFKNTTMGTTVGTYTLSGCVADGTTASRFDLPDVGNEFNRVEITGGNTAGETGFYVRAIRTCDSVAASCWTSTVVTNCAYP